MYHYPTCSRPLISPSWRLTAAICCLGCVVVQAVANWPGEVRVHPLNPVLRPGDGSEWIQDWGITVLQSPRSAVVFNCPNFAGLRKQLGDVRLDMQILEVQGALQAVPVQPADASNWKIGISEADLALFLSGTGTAKIRLAIRLLDQNEELPAGDYHTTLQARVIQP